MRVLLALLIVVVVAIAAPASSNASEGCGFSDKPTLDAKVFKYEWPAKFAVDGSIFSFEVGATKNPLVLIPDGCLLMKVHPVGLLRLIPWVGNGS